MIKQTQKWRSDWHSLEEGDVVCILDGRGGMNITVSQLKKRNNKLWLGFYYSIEKAIQDNDMFVILPPIGEKQ